MSMRREDRYVVLKRKDIVAALSREELLRFTSLVEKIAFYRKERGKRNDSFVCVADDWPEYEAVWKMIEARIDAEHDSPATISGPTP